MQAHTFPVFIYTYFKIAVLAEHYKVYTCMFLQLLCLAAFKNQKSKMVPFEHLSRSGCALKGHGGGVVWWVYFAIPRILIISNKTL